MSLPEIKNILYNRILELRNNSFLTKICTNILIKNNLQDEEILSFEFVNGYPLIVLKDGTILISSKDENLSVNKSFQTLEIPDTHISLILSYILRFKYPHCMPSEKINTGIIPRRLFPSLIHRQHINTLFELPKQKRNIFTERLKINPGDRILELGPFIGFGTLRMSRLVGEKGQIVSVEADNRAYEILKMNINNNNIENVKSFNCAVTSENSDYTEFFEGEKQANSLIPGFNSTLQRKVIKGRTIESLISEARFEPNFIILTINGAELQALSACKNFLNKTKQMRIISPGWYSDGSNGKTGPRIIEFLLSLGFKVAHTSGMHIFAYK